MRLGDIFVILKLLQRKEWVANYMKILIADDKANVRYGLAVLLEEHRGVDVIGETAGFFDLVQMISNNCPDMILLSLELPGQDGETMIKSLRLICPNTSIIVMSSQPEVSVRVLELGADHFISKANAPVKLLEVINQYINNIKLSSSLNAE
jgi:DNA-binding NarL/FixJ family response regulator